MHKPEPIQENETYKNLGNFEMQTDHLISARRPNLMLIKKKKRTSHLKDVGESQSENKRKWNEWEDWKSREHGGDSDITNSWRARNSPKGLEKKTEGIGNQRKDR